jgi:hypothetical protein
VKGVQIARMVRFAEGIRSALDHNERVSSSTRSADAGETPPAARAVAGPGLRPSPERGALPAISRPLAELSTGRRTRHVREVTDE